MRVDKNIMNHVKVPVAVHLLLIKDNKILLSRRYKTGFEDGNYSLVAGHVECGETIKQAMIREAKEEANIVLDSKNLKSVQVMYRKTNIEERIDYFLVAEQWTGNLRNNEPNKCDDLRWFNFYEIPSNIVAYIKYALEKYLDGDVFTEFGW